MLKNERLMGTKLPTLENSQEDLSPLKEIRALHKLFFTNDLNKNSESLIKIGK